MGLLLSLATGIIIGALETGTPRRLLFALLVSLLITWSHLRLRTGVYSMTLGRAGQKHRFTISLAFAVISISCNLIMVTLGVLCAHATRWLLSL